MQRLLTFFKNDGFKHGQFEIDGSDPTGDYTEGMAGANAVGAIALKDKDLQRLYIERLWNVKAPSGQWRYYNGMVYMLSMLHVSGKFRIY
jgi:oligosaccharide reducing-end xylanase